MAVAHRAPLGLVALIGAITVVPLALLTWFGLRLIEQDRVLEAQQTRQRVERAADLAVAALDREVRAWEQRLPRLDGNWREPAVAFTFAQDRPIRAVPALAYWPVTVSQPEAPATMFARGESLEFRDRNYAAAASAYRRLAGSTDNPAVKAGAIARLGRALESLGRSDEARESLSSLASEDNVNVHGAPASLVATYAVGRSLERSGSGEPLLRLAGDLSRGLDSGRWRLTPDLYALYRADAVRWGAAEPTRPHWPEVLAEAVSVMWKRWQSGEWKREPLVTREVLHVQDQRLTLVWTVAGSFHGLVVTPQFVDAHWRPAVEDLEREHAVEVSIVLPSRGVTVTAGGHELPSAGRAHQITGLPWTLDVRSADPPPERAEFATRRRWILSGLALFGLLAAAASYLIYRAVSREMALARQQADFVSAVSHEFRTPLTSMRQFTEMLMDQPGLSPERRRQAYAAQQRATDRLSRLVESLLEFGRLQAGASRVHVTPGALDQFLHDVVEDFKSDSVAGSHPVVLETEPIVVAFDPGALSTAIRNLLENAAKYSPDAQPIEVGLRRVNGCAHISVRDHGIGIPESERGRVFGRFTRGERARTLGIRGTGIGLAMVAEIVREHRGEVRVESVEGEGSTFTISIPARS